jgi:hypothetical protein
LEQWRASGRESAAEDPGTQPGPHRQNWNSTGWHHLAEVHQSSECCALVSWRRLKCWIWSSGERQKRNQEGSILAHDHQTKLTACSWYVIAGNVAGCRLGDAGRCLMEGASEQKCSQIRDTTAVPTIQPGSSTGWHHLAGCTESSDVVLVGRRS